MSQFWSQNGNRGTRAENSEITPKVGPNQFPQLMSQNGTQFGAREQHNTNIQPNPKFSQKLEMGQQLNQCIYQKRAVYSKM
uniref:Uncharacterized protein n=1 Tax=Solanum tuberosum TaxID=4113 RepID=M1D299_SOLTU